MSRPPGRFAGPIDQAWPKLLVELDPDPPLVWSCCQITWNAFKRIAAGASETEQSARFAGTAARVHAVPLDAAELPQSGHKAAIAS